MNVVCDLDQYFTQGRHSSAELLRELQLLLPSSRVVRAHDKLDHLDELEALLLNLVLEKFMWLNRHSIIALVKKFFCKTQPYSGQ